VLYQQQAETQRMVEFWQRDRAIVLMTVGVIVAELLLIGTLLAERRRRIHAQAEAEEQHRHAEETRRQVAHMARVAMLGELAATMSHEIRQPLAAIRANAETGARLAARGAGDDADGDRAMYAEIFDAIVSDNTRASDIITRVRALVRREALPQRAVDLNEVCRTAARLLEYEAKTRHAQIALSLEPDLPSAVGDPIQFQQVVLNLMMNALDASASANSPRLIVRTKTCGEEIAVEVRDNGPGISEEHRAHLFESFYTTKRDGLGLGLAIAHSIVERHRGRVEAENAELGGAIFRIVVPGLRTIRVNSAEARLEFASDLPVAHLPD
jgi:signal transduction histidine kinase